jgi:hypothetical protein
MAFVSVNVPARKAAIISDCRVPAGPLVEKRMRCKGAELAARLAAFCV